jgi:O-antigen/teichoic acid export membrane protein
MLTPRQPGSRGQRRGAVRFDQPSTDGLARRALLSLIGLSANGSARLITAVLIGRLGGPGLLGATQSAMSLAQLLALAWPSSAGSAASRFVAGARGRGNVSEAAAVASFLLKRIAIVGVSLGVIGVMLWWGLGFGSLYGGLIVAALTIAYSFYSVARGVQLGAGQVRRSATLDVVGAGVAVIGVGSLLLVGVRSLILLLPLATSYLLYALFTRIPRAAPRLDRSVRREISLFVVLGIVGTIASAGFLQLSVLVIRASGGRELAGQYAAALALATPLSMLAASVSLSLFPMLAEAAARGDIAAVRDQTTRSTASLTALMLCFIGPVALMGKPLVVLLWGEEFLVAGEMVALLLVAVLLNTVSVPSVNALTSGSSNGMAISAATSVTGLLVGCAAWVVLVPSSPVVGVPIGYLVGVFVISSTPVVIVWRRDQHVWSHLWGRFAIGLIALGAALTWQNRVVMSPAQSLGLAAGFLLLWFVISRSDVVIAVRSLGR